MSVTYYIQPIYEGTDEEGFTVQRVANRLDEFYSYHKTREEAEASMANGYKREAADDLYAALEGAATFLRWLVNHSLPVYSDMAKSRLPRTEAALRKAQGES